MPSEPGCGSIKDARPPAATPQNANSLGNRIAVVPNQDFVVKEGQILYFASDDARVVLDTPAGAFKVCHLKFAKDGSIFVQVPYFKGGTEGILSCLALTGKEEGQVTVDLKPGGKVVSHLVKLSHHTDGKVHFSQDGKIKSEIGRAAWALGDKIGRVFELNIFDLNGLERFDREKKGQLMLPFKVIDGTPAGISVVGEWLRKKDLIAAMIPPDGTLGPRPTVKSKKTGEEAVRFLFGQPAGYGMQDHVLMITCRPIPMPEGLSAPTAILLGGWDAHEGEAKIENKGLLVAMYPCGDFDKLAATIGSLDFNPSA